MDQQDQHRVSGETDTSQTADNSGQTQESPNKCRPVSLCSADMAEDVCESVSQKLKHAGLEYFGTSTSVQDVTPDTDKGDAGITKKKKKKKKRSTIRIFYGTFIHSTKEEPLVILNKWLIGVEKGKILFSEAAESHNSLVELYHLEDVKKDITICLAEGAFMMPGFVDAHTDAHSFLTAGIQGKGLKVQDKLSLIHDDRVATNLFTKVIDRTLQLGTTSIAYNGSHVESAARLLANVLVRTKQRTSVGISLSTPDDRDDLHFVQLTKCQDVIEHVQRKKSSHNGNVGAQLLVDSLLPNWLEEKVAAIQLETGATVKVSMNSLPTNYGHDEDAKTQMTPLQYHAKHGLINEQTIAIHGSACTPADLVLLKDSGAGLVYCPAADIKYNNYTDLSKLVASGVPVGLGSDLTNSGSLSMLMTVRQCTQVNNHQCVLRGTGSVCTQCKGINRQNGIAEPDTRPVTYRDFFKMATLGGAEVLGLSSFVGNFEVGKEFDAILVDPHVPDCAFCVIPGKDTAEDILQRFLFCGDDRNITAVYISGQRVK